MDVDEEYEPWLSAVMKLNEQDVAKKKQLNPVKNKKQMKDEIVETAREIQAENILPVIKLQEEQEEKLCESEVELERENRNGSNINEFHYYPHPIEKYAPSLFFAYILFFAAAFSVGSICYIVYQLVSSLHFDLMQQANQKSSGKNLF